MQIHREKQSWWLEPLSSSVKALTSCFANCEAQRLWKSARRLDFQVGRHFRLLKGEAKKIEIQKETQGKVNDEQQG